MPLTFYIYKGPKHRRIAILTLARRPTDWAELKEHLKVCALKLWNEQKISSALITLELHLSGKFVWKRRRGGYSPRRVRWQRGVEWAGRLRFNSKTEEITVDNCSFGPNLMSLASDYYAERGIKYRTPSVIPKEHQNLHDPRSLLMDPSATRYADYTTPPRSPYDHRQKRGEKKRLQYDPTCVGRSYLPEGLRIREEELKTKVRKRA